MKNQLYLLIIPILLLTSSQFLTAQSCSCTEYIYLNEQTNGGAIHKYAVNPDGSITEVGGINGMPWYESVDWPSTDQLSAPHAFLLIKYKLISPPL